MDKRILISMLLVLVMLPAGFVLAADENDKDEEKSLTPADKIKIAKAVAPSLVRVEWTVKFDKGEAPPGGEQAIREERALEQTGFLLSPTLVLTEDITTHPRFIKRLFVTFGDQEVDAKVKSYARGHEAMLLELSKPLKGAEPLAFDAKTEPPYLVVHYGRYGTTLTVRVWPLRTAVSTTQTGRQYRSAPSACLIVDEKGKPVTVSMDNEWPIDDSWKGSPLKWPTVPAEKMKKALADLENAAGKGLMRVTLNFRSPKKRGGRGYYGGDESQTEHQTTGVLIGKDRIVVLANMLPKVTARLERITVHPPKGKPVAAKFKCTLKDYGCFIATPAKPLAGPVKLATGDIRKYRNQLLLTAKIIIQGKKRTAYFGHGRIASYDLGWKRHVYPEVHWGANQSFFFDFDGALVAVPVARREKVSVKERWGGSRGSLLTATAYLKEVLGNLDKNTDAANIPLTEEEENRLAWMGVELQALNTELARINNVSDLTNDGSTGAIVSYVYPGSPAEKAGIEVGYILLRIHAEDQPKPIEVRVERHGFGGRAFPWDRLDQIPEQYYDRIPRPWPGRENLLTRALTDLGFKKKYQAEFFHDGKIVKKAFNVVVSPPHYDTAKRHKSKPLGLTVRNLTYELRRYFQKKIEDPGVIVSKIEPGSKASVSGLKPYEMITHVNGQPVADVKEFEKLIKDQAELQLLVKRMTRGRTVKIKLPKATTKPAATTKPVGK